jgi:ribosome biogenesis GTPase A
VTGNPEAQTNILVVGMPNVGKSSFLNALRRVGVHKGESIRVGFGSTRVAGNG